MDMSLDAELVSIKNNASDQANLLELLAVKFNEVLPHHTSIETSSGLFSGKKVKSIEITLGDILFAVEKKSKQLLQFTVRKAVKGVTIKSQTVSFAEWAHTLTEKVHADAEKSGEDTANLNQFIML